MEGKVKRMAKRKARHCKVCGEKMPGTRLWICDFCSALGRSVPPKGEIQAEELLEVARRREQELQNPLEGMDIDEKAALAREFRPPYATYGRFCAYVKAFGKLPPVSEERKA